MPIKTVKIRPLNNIPQFHSPNRFDALQITKDDNDKESGSNSIKIQDQSIQKLKPEQQLCL